MSEVPTPGNRATLFDEQVDLTASMVCEIFESGWKVDNGDTLTADVALEALVKMNEVLTLNNMNTAVSIETLFKTCANKIHALQFYNGGGSKPKKKKANRSRTKPEDAARKRKERRCKE